jgi:ubiquitin carboxyl-terminal hydrolase 5/13
MHYKATLHPVLMNVRRVPKTRSSEEEPPQKLTKLEIVAEEPESEKYDFHTSVHCLACNLSIPTTEGNVTSLSNSFLICSSLGLFPLFWLHRQWLDNLRFKPFRST